MSTTDAAVVGAGPAGTWAAYSLARAGARVTIFDASHPREKPCGGGLTWRTLALLHGVLEGGRVPLVPITSVRFESEKPGARAREHKPAARSTAHHALPEVVSTRFPLPADGLLLDVPLAVVSRSALDGALLAAALEAGATLVPERVLDVSAGSGPPRVRTAKREVVAEFLLGADGAASVVRRRLLGGFSRSQLSLATGYFVYGTTSSETVLRCTGDPAGYFWSFPRPDHLAIGICAQADGAASGPLREYVARWISDCRAPAARLKPYSWPIPSLSRTDVDRQRPGTGRWMLLGDAAGLVDPLTREGIYFAIKSAELAAASLTDGAADPAAAYVDHLRAEVFSELERAAALKTGFFSPRFTCLLVEALGRSEPVRRIMVDLIAGRQAYAGLRRRLAGTFEVGLAWRLLKLELRGRFAASLALRDLRHPGSRGVPTAGGGYFAQ
jgi:flavin-dependent dehydrogenase